MSRAIMLTALGYRVGRYVPAPLPGTSGLRSMVWLISRLRFRRRSGHRGWHDVGIGTPAAGPGHIQRVRTADRCCFIYFRERQMRRRRDRGWIRRAIRLDESRSFRCQRDYPDRSRALDVLGPTIEQVAWNKAGIVKAGRSGRGLQPSDLDVRLSSRPRPTKDRRH